MSLKGQNKNIVLIGMPGVGKSTIGVILAKVMSRHFIDTDVFIQVREGRTLQEIIDREGLKTFCGIEEGYVVSLASQKSIIATGGSVVYSNSAMDALRSNGILIHLYLPLDHLEKRLKDFKERGVVKQPDQTLRDLFFERLPIYQRYADITIDCSGKNHEEVISEIMGEIKKIEM